MRSLRLLLGMPALVLAFLAVDTATQVAFKVAADTIGDVPLGLAYVGAVATTASAWVAVGFYVVTYVLWMLVLKDTALSRAFPLTALSYVTVPLLGWLAFGEEVGGRTVAGIVLILVGVVLVGKETDAPAGAPSPSELSPCGNP